MCSYSRAELVVAGGQLGGREDYKLEEVAIVTDNRPNLILWVTLA